jgi:hypothetical protein
VFLEVTKLRNSESLTLPVLPTLLVSLTGISQVTHLAAKAVRPALVSINEIRPGRIQLHESNNTITILGSNFGKIGTVSLEYYQPVTEEEKRLHCPRPRERIKKREDADAYEKEWAEEFRYYNTRLEEQLDVTPKTPKWDDNRIAINLDSIRDKLKPREYVVRVEKDGLLTYANLDAAFYVALSVVKLYPSNGSTNVPIYSSINAEFNGPVRILTVTSSTFVIRDSNNNQISGIITSDGLTATFKPVQGNDYY